MKKLLALVLALAVALCALTVTAFADETVVFDNPDGQSWSDLVNSWDFFGTDGYWGRTSATGVLSLEWADIKPIMEAGGATFTYVYGADSAGTPSLNLTFDGNSAGNGVNAPFTVTDLGDGKYEATVALDDMVAAWTATGLTLDDAEAFLVQVWTDNFKLYSAKFNTGADAVAPAETPAETEAPAETPAEETPAEAPAETPAETPAPEAPKTGLALAVVPAVVALAAVAVSKKH